MSPRAAQLAEGWVAEQASDHEGEREVPEALDRHNDVAPAIAGFPHHETRLATYGAALIYVLAVLASGSMLKLHTLLLANMHLKATARKHVQQTFQEIQRRRAEIGLWQQVRCQVMEVPFEVSARHIAGNLHGA